MLKSLITSLMRAFNGLFSLWIVEKIRRFNDIRYSVWASRCFSSIGTNASICKPLHLKGGGYITIGDNFSAGYRTRIEAWDEYAGQKFSPKIVIGNNVCFNYDCHVGAINSIEIHDNVLIGSRVLITDHNHGDTSTETLKLPPVSRPLISNGAVVIEKNVWIGEGVAILAGVIIGQNSIVASNSVVTRSFPANCVIAGVPAKIIKEIKL